MVLRIVAACILDGNPVMHLDARDGKAKIFSNASQKVRRKLVRGLTRPLLVCLLLFTSLIVESTMAHVRHHCEILRPVQVAFKLPDECVRFEQIFEASVALALLLNVLVLAPDEEFLLNFG